MDRPRDIRSRRFMLAWDTPSQAAPPGLSPSEPVFRVTYNCSGSCSWPAPDPSSSENPALTEEDPEEDVEEDHVHGKKPRVRCPHSTRIQVRVKSTSLSSPDIYIMYRWRFWLKISTRRGSGHTDRPFILQPMLLTWMPLLSCASKPWNAPLWV